MKHTYYFDYGIGDKVRYRNGRGEVRELRVYKDGIIYLVVSEDNEVLIKEEGLELIYEYDFREIEKRYSFVRDERMYITTSKGKIERYINRHISKEGYNLLLDIPKKLKNYVDYDRLDMYLDHDPETYGSELLISPKTTSIHWNEASDRIMSFNVHWLSENMNKEDYGNINVMSH